MIFGVMIDKVAILVTGMVKVIGGHIVSRLRCLTLSYKSREVPGSGIMYSKQSRKQTNKQTAQDL